MTILGIFESKLVILGFISLVIIAILIIALIKGRKKTWKWVALLLFMGLAAYLAIFSQIFGGSN